MFSASRSIAIVVLLLCVALTAQGSETYFNGFTTPAGYQYLNGYWWLGDQPYSRTWVNACGSAPSYWQYSYAVITPPVVQVVTPPPTIAPQPVAVAPPVSVAAELQAALGKLAALKQQAAEADSLLRGAAGQPYQGGTGYAGTGGPASLQLSTAGVNSTTVYGSGYGAGQSYNSIASFYGDVNLQGLYQQANRLAENAQKLSGQATGDFSNLVKEEGGNRARVAEIMAKAELMKAMFPPEGRIEQRKVDLKFGPKDDAPQPLPNATTPAPQADPAALKTAWAGHAAKACGACHGGTRAEGGFALKDFPGMDAAAKAGVVARITTTNEKKRMPRDGPALTPAEVALWKF